MGLDMYLYANKYISKAEWRGEEASKQFDEIVKIMQADEFIRKDLPSGSVNFQVAYWRKANQIHKWFVNNVQDGEDDCREYSVDREQLQKLLDTCKKVKADGSLADEYLPPSEGFFFGSNEIDEWYWQDIDSTIEMLTDTLTHTPEDYGFTYQSSW
jgi:hypothetical protein